MNDNAFRIRLGALALAVSGIAFLAYPAVRPWHNEATVSGATASMSSNAWVAAHFFAMVGFILLPLGLMAVRAAVSASRSERLTLLALVVTWIGVGLTLPYYGAEDFGLHAIAGPKGDPTRLLGLVDAVRYQPLAITIFGIGLILLAIGAILVAVAVWRSGVLPKASATVFAIGFALFLPQFFTGAVVRIAHGAFLAVGLVALAAALWRQPRTQGTGVAGGMRPRTEVEAASLQESGPVVSRR